MTKTWCVGGRHHSETTNQKLYEKVNARTNKIVKAIKGSCSMRGRNKSQTFIK